MVRKVVTTLVLAGSVALGAAGTASAQPGPRCTNAASRIARLQGEETQVASEMAALEARLDRHHHAVNLRRELWALRQEDALLAGQIRHLQAACPGTSGTDNNGTGGDPTTTTTTTTGSNGGSPPTTTGNGGGTTTVGSTFAD